MSGTPSNMPWIKVSGFFLLLMGSYFIVTRTDVVSYLTPGHIADYVQTFGPMAPLALILLMALAVVLSPIPSLPIDLAAGVAFGPWFGTLYAVVGAEIGAIVSFLIGRAVGRDVLTRVLKLNVVFCEKCADHHLIGMVILARLIPMFSFDLVSYGAGLTRMSLKAFALATLVGMIPPTFALVYFGSSAMTFRWPVILSAIVLVIVFLFLPRWIMRNRSAWWVRMIQGTQPDPSHVSKSVSNAVVASTINKTCDWCGEEH